MGSAFSSFSKVKASKVYTDSNSISSHHSLSQARQTIDDDDGKLPSITRMNSMSISAPPPNQYSISSPSLNQNTNSSQSKYHANSHTLSAIKDTALLIKYPARNILPAFLWEAQLILQESEFIRKLFKEFIFLGLSNSDEICEWAHYLLELLNQDTNIYGNNNNNYLQKVMSHSLDDVLFQDYILFSKDISLINNSNSAASSSSSSVAATSSPSSLSSSVTNTKLIANHPLSDPQLFLRNSETIKKKMIKCTHLKFKDTLTNEVGILKPQLSSLHSSLSLRGANFNTNHSSGNSIHGNSIHGNSIHGNSIHGNHSLHSSANNSNTNSSSNAANTIPGLNGVSPCFSDKDLKVVSVLVLWILFRAHNKELRGFLNSSGTKPGEAPVNPDSFSALGYNSTHPTQTLSGLLSSLNKNHPPQVARVFQQILHGVKSLTSEYLEEIMTKGQWVHDVVTAIDNLPCSISISSLEVLKNNNKKNSAYNNTLSPMESLNLDKTYPIIYVNKQFEKLTLYSRSQILGNSLSLLQNSQLTEWDQLVKLINCLYNPNINSIKIGITNQKKDNSIFFNFLAVRIIKPLKPASSSLDNLNIIGIQYDINAKDSSINDLRQIDDALVFLTLLTRR